MEGREEEGEGELLLRGEGKEEARDGWRERGCGKEW